MTLTYTRFCSIYLLAGFLIAPGSALLGFSLTPFSDTLIVLVFLTTLLNDKNFVLQKRLERGLAWMLALMSFATVQLLSNFRYGLSFDVLDSMRKGRGVLVFFVTIYVFIYALSSATKDQIAEFDRLIDAVLKLNVAVLLVEGAYLNVFGGQAQIAAVFGTEYKIQPNYFIFPGVPNGLVLGFQHGSIMALAGVLRWAPLLKGASLSRRQTIWLVLSLAALLVTLTGTSIFVMAAVLALSTFVRHSRTNRLVFRTASLLACLLLASFFWDIMGVKLTNYSQRVRRNEGTSVQTTLSRTQARYQRQFYDPIRMVIENPVEAMLGSNYSDERAGTSGLSLELVHADFGVGYFALRFGVLLALALIILYSSYVVSAIRTLRRKEFRGNVNASSALLITFTLVVSTVHYTTLFKQGPLQLAAALIAMLYVTMKRSAGSPAVSARRPGWQFQQPRRHAIGYRG